MLRPSWATCERCMLLWPLPLWLGSTWSFRRDTVVHCTVFQHLLLYAPQGRSHLAMRCEAGSLVSRCLLLWPP